MMIAMEVVRIIWIKIWPRLMEYIPSTENAGLKLDPFWFGGVIDKDGWGAGKIGLLDIQIKVDWHNQSKEIYK